MSRALVRAVEELAGLAGDAVVVARDPAALARLQRARLLPPTYVEFLRTHSSHDFVDAGLVCAGRPVWLTPVDALEEIAACYQDRFPPQWQVCAVEPGGCYVLDLSRRYTDTCAVLHIDEAGAREEIARDFLEFVRRIVRETAAARGLADMSERPVYAKPTTRPAPRELGLVARLAVVLAVTLVLVLAFRALF